MTTLLSKLFGTFLGVEFREDTLVLSFVKNGISGMSLLSSSTFPLRSDDSTLAEIRGYIDRQGARPDRVFASVPDRWAIIKLAEIPSIKGKGKDAVINLMRFEIERHIPFNIEEVSFDFLVLDEKDAAYSVAFVAVHKEKMDSVTAYLEKLSLRPDTVIPSSFAVLNAVELSGVTAGGLQDVMGFARRSKIFGQREGVNVSLYVDRLQTSMSVLREGRYVYHRSFPFTTDQGPGPFADEIARNMNEIKARFSTDRLHTVILSGDLSSIGEAVHEMKEKTDAEIITLDMVSDFTAGTNREDINMLAASVGACFAGTGASAYDINLLPHKMKFGKQRTVPVSTRIFLALALVLVIGIFTAEAVKKKQYLEKIEAELKKNGPAVSAIEKVSSEIGGLQDRINTLRTLKDNEITLELLTEITGLFPKDAWITNFEYRVHDVIDKKEGIGEIVISGSAASSSSLIPLLEDSPYLEKVAFVGPVKKSADKEQFRLNAQVVFPQKKKEEQKDEGEKRKEGPQT